MQPSRIQLSKRNAAWKWIFQRKPKTLSRLTHKSNLANIERANEWLLGRFG